MRYRNRFVSVLVCLFFVLPLNAEQSLASPPQQQPQVLLQNSLAALAGSSRITDVTLTGSARRIAGSDDESGTVTLRVLSSGATRLDFNFPSGQRSEFRSSGSSSPTGGPTGMWSGPDGVAHAIANHNLMCDWGWFPAFTIAAATSQTSVLALVGPETRNGQSVLHLTASQQFPSLKGATAVLRQHLSQVDFFLDSTTSLPVSVAYSIHPDNNALLDIPVELQFSDYRQINGAQIPFHIQKFINNTLHLDIQLNSASLNTGLTAAKFVALASLPAPWPFVAPSFRTASSASQVGAQ